MLTYTKLWLLLDAKGLKRTDLKQIMSSATLAKLGKNEPISSTVIEKICDFLKCQPGDIMENITREDLERFGTEFNDKVEQLMKSLEVATGMSREAMLDQFEKGLPMFKEKLLNGNTDYIGLETVMNETDK